MNSERCSKNTYHEKAVETSYKMEGSCPSENPVGKGTKIQKPAN